MPIRIKTDLNFGDTFYIKNDPDQFEYILVGVIVTPGNQMKFRLSLLGDLVEVFDYECSKDINLALPEKGEEE